MRHLFIDLGAFAGAGLILLGLGAIYWPLAAIAGGGALLILCLMVARNEPTQSGDSRGNS